MLPLLVETDWGGETVLQIVEQGSHMPSAKNERITENIVRDELRRLGYLKKNGNKIRVEEQKSQIEAVKKLMKAASKSGHGGIGSPEFIISSLSDPDFLVIVECKADPQDHISDTCKDILAGVSVVENDEHRARRVQRYAVDGVLHYASKLAKEFYVVAVAVSGAEGSVAISTYLHARGGESPKPLRTKEGQDVSTIIPWPDYVEHGTFDPSVQRIRSDELMAFSRELHDFMRDHAKLTESEKPLMVSGTLIALRNKPFAISFEQYTPEELQNEWLQVIAKEIHKADIPKGKKDKMVQPYSTIAAHPELGKSTKAYPKGILHELIKRLNEKVWPFISIYHDFDVVGQFYGEFLKYTGGDKKALGIVLTPRHVTELFALLARLDKKSRVLDICAGTGGFLISAMHQMMKLAVTNADKDRIRQRGLVGVEQQPNMFALVASNMILRGDGKANLYQGSCFEDEQAVPVKEHKCNVGMLNPPFSQGDNGLHELRFIKQMLECLTKGGIGLALAPMSCAIAPHPVRRELLESHTLEAVMSMPDELFYPVGAIVCIMVFTAKIPHATSGKKTWFGYWRDDGFVKTKHKGRLDLYGRWPAIRDRWIETFLNREVHAGECVTQLVGPDDEWCAEAYMETDYSKLTKDDFERAVKNYAIFKLLGSQDKGEPDNEEAK